MKTKTPKPSDDRKQLRGQMHELVNYIMLHLERPENWPLSPPEQAAFIRTVMYRAKKIKESKGFRLEVLEYASEELAMSS